MPCTRLTSNAPRILLLAVFMLALGACQVMNAIINNEYVVSPAELQSQLSRRFPIDYTAGGGLATLRLTNPRVRLDGANHRLLLDADAALGLLGATPAPGGHLLVSSGLRYDAAQAALMLDAPRVEQVDIPALGGSNTGMVPAAINRWLTQYAANTPAYRLDAQTQAKMRGRSIESVQVQERGLVVQLVPVH